MFLKRTELKRVESGQIVYHIFPELEALGFFRHWITSRHGGVSEGAYASLNLADHVGDRAEAVAENRRRIFEIFTGGRPVYLPEQVHSAECIEVSTAEDFRQKCDSVLVGREGVAVGVLTADCIPVILADPASRSAAVVHAGRAGVFMKIVTQTVLSMSERFGTDPGGLFAAVGPGIRSCCYEVGGEVFEGYEEFKSVYSPAGEGKGKLDMVSALSGELERAGLDGDAVLDCGVCTSCESEEFFSHRTQTLKGLGAGRFMTGLSLF
jgi:hypothetical protein